VVAEEDHPASLRDDVPGLSLRQEEALLFELVCSGDDMVVHKLVQKSGMTRSEVVEILADPEFKQKLKDWTFAFCYLPQHRRAIMGRIDSALNGSTRSEEAVFRQFLDEGREGDEISMSVKAKGNKGLAELKEIFARRLYGLED
jgi:hypothetical protein